ncbi:MAG TPA: lipoate--protein ligase family protein, partial [Bacteroidetes bacterium]|nr:lipoate--protein ligase family protein [Bacteroidota bacterium]
RTEGGSVEFHLNVKKGVIKDIRIFGDFFHKHDIDDVQNSLVGVKHEREAILHTLSQFDFNSYFKNIKVEEFVGGMF